MARVLVFGDSITQGYWDVDAGGWVGRTRRYYDEQQLRYLDADGFSIFNLGIDGNDSNDILARIEAEVQARTSHSKLPVVLVQIGINDSSVDHGATRVPLDVYKANLEAIIQKLSHSTAKLIFVGSSACDETKTTPVAWGDYIYANTTIKTYEDAMMEVAVAHNLPFIPVFDAFKAKLDAGADLLTDGLHPNSTGHRLIFEIIQPKLQASLV